MNQTLNINGLQFTLQEWKICGNVNTVKYSTNNNLKSNKTKIIRSKKMYSLIY